MSRNARSVWFMLLLAHTAPARIASSASSHGATCHSERCDGPRSAENVKWARVTKRFGRSRCLIAVLVFDLAGCFASFSLADAIREQRWTYIYIYIASAGLRAIECAAATLKARAQRQRIVVVVGRDGARNYARAHSIPIYMF